MFSLRTRVSATGSGSWLGQGSCRPRSENFLVQWLPPRVVQGTLDNAQKHVWL